MAGEHEPDGITESVEDLLRAGMLIGTRLAERHARTREHALRDAARNSLHDARAERDHQHAQQQLALSQLERVFSPTWWEHASAEDIRQAWTAARTYQHDDARAARGVWRIADEVKDRYRLDAFEVDPAAFGTRIELERRTPVTDQELARYDRALARRRGLLDAGDTAAQDPERHGQLQQRRAEIDELRELIAEERARTQESPEQRRARELRELADVTLVASVRDETLAPGYDTRERRTLLAERLAALDIDAEATRAVVLADAANAQPPELAAAVDPRSTPRARSSTQARRGRRQARRPRS
jgi:hypothetical protein